MKIEEGNKIEIFNADLGRTSFINCDFSKATLAFSSSKIIDIAVIGTQFPNPKLTEIRWISENELRSYSSMSTIRDSSVRPLGSYRRFEKDPAPEIMEALWKRADDLVQKKLILSQLKKVYENRGDHLTAGKYHAEELNVHIHTLKPGWEKVNLLLNKWTNNHGQDWRRACFVLLGMLAIMFTVYCLILGVRPDLSFSNSAVNEFFRLAGLSFEYLNPIRKSDFLPKVILNAEAEPTRSLVVFWDSLSKIVFAYLIYQLIAAFRKHGRTK